MAARRDFAALLYELRSKKPTNVRIVVQSNSVDIRGSNGSTLIRSIPISEVDDINREPQVSEKRSVASCFGSGKKSAEEARRNCGVQIVLFGSENAAGETVHLILNSVEERDALRVQVKRAMATNKKEINDKLEATMFDELLGADKNKDDLLSLDEVQRFVAKFNRSELEKLPEIFDRIDANHDGNLDFREFKLLCYELWSFPELDGTFTRHCTSNLMNEAQFIEFLSSELKITLQPADAKIQFDFAVVSFEISESAKDSHCLTLAGFRRMYLSNWELLRLFDYPKRKVYQDMTKPLNCYWISSSHNTYLEGAQLLGTASAEAYKRTLLAGARCVELDVYDGKREPEVRHGHVSSSLPLRDALQAILETAFCKSEFPVIMAIEDNMRRQQPIAARIIREVFQDTLYSSFGRNLPSPEALKGKIVVRAGAAEFDAEPAADDTTDGTHGGSAKKESSGLCVSVPKLQLYFELNRVAALRKCKFKQFGQTYRRNGVFSFNETSALDCIRTQRVAFATHASRYLVRIYPKGNRIFSGNYAEADAAAYWNVGAQVVAFNMQTTDSGKLLNKCLFKDNGRCGYVLKPPITGGQNAALPDSVWEFQVLRAFRLPKVANVALLKVKLSVVGEDANANPAKETGPASVNEPLWNETFQLQLKSSALDFLKVEVLDASSGKPLFNHLIRVDNIGIGLRTVPLTLPNGRRLDSGCLFMHVTIQHPSSGRPARPTD